MEGFLQSRGETQTLDTHHTVSYVLFEALNDELTPKG